MDKIVFKKPTAGAKATHFQAKPSVSSVLPLAREEEEDSASSTDGHTERKRKRQLSHKKGDKESHKRERWK